MSLRQSFQLFRDFQSHPGCRLKPCPKAVPRRQKVGLIFRRSEKSSGPGASAAFGRCAAAMQRLTAGPGRGTGLFRPNKERMFRINGNREKLTGYSDESIRPSQSTP
jgi:hypothetical protein